MNRIALDTRLRRMGRETGEPCKKILKSHGLSVSHPMKGHNITFGIRT
jgi:hypothetical protein